MADEDKIWKLYAESENLFPAGKFMAQEIQEIEDQRAINQLNEYIAETTNDPLYIQVGPSLDTMPVQKNDNNTYDVSPWIVHAKNTYDSTVTTASNNYNAVTYYKYTEPEFIGAWPSKLVESRSRRADKSKEIIPIDDRRLEERARVLLDHAAEGRTSMGVRLDFFAEPDAEEADIRTEKPKRVRYPVYRKNDRVQTPIGPGSVWSIDRDGTICVEVDSDSSILHEFEKKELKKIKITL